MPTTVRSTHSHAGRARRALPLLLLAAAACADGPSSPPPPDLDLLRAAALASDSLGMFGGAGVMPMRFGLVAPVPIAPIMPGGGGAISFVGPGCAYSPTSGRTECGPTTFNGMTFSSTFAFFDREGRAQERFDPATTDRIESTNRIAGTATYPLRGPNGQEGTVSLTVDRAAAHSTSGLLDPSGRRRLDGTGAGTESQTVTTPRGTLRLAREFADTTTNLVLPPFQLPSDRLAGPFVPPAPLSGRVVRVSRTVETPPTGAPRTTDLRVVTEFLAGGVARTTFTVNGVTHVCTQDLTRLERPQCS